MQKPASLRAAITAMIPDLGRDPDRLRLWVDKGRIRCQQTASRNFHYEYTLSLLVTEYVGETSIVLLIVNEWLRDNQPDRCGTTADSGYSFEAEIVDGTSVDLLLEIPLTEDVIVTPRAGRAGGWNIDHPGEVQPMLPDDVPLCSPAAPLAEVWSAGAKVLG